MKKKEKTPKHSVFSPSSAKRWMTCPGSIALSMQCPEPETSKYAEEGTRAHDLAERALPAFLSSDPEQAKKAIQLIKDEADDMEMQECVVNYIQYILNFYYSKELV